jgi:hypothetical protein
MNERQKFLPAVLVLLALGLATPVLSGPAAGGPAPKPPLDPGLVHSADSLRREIEKRTYSDADKKEIRACGREKSEFLRQARGAEAGYAGTDKALNEAKLAGADMNDPAVLALMEKKFSFEKRFDERYLATPGGKKCSEGESRRRKALEAALAKDRAYQDLLKRIAASAANPM